MDNLKNILQLPINQARAAAKGSIDQTDLRLVEIADREKALEKDKELVDKAISDSLRYKQRTMDTKRIQSKALRHSNRLDSINENLLEAILDNISNSMVYPPEEKGHTDTTDGSVGILQLSDLHINEVITEDETNGTNKYNYQIAAKRLTKYVDRAIKQFKRDKVTKVLVACTGDLINNCSILDKAINNEEAKATAILIAADLIYQAIYDLLNNGFEITLATVIGNESRLSEYAYSKKAAINNADILIYYILQAKLGKSINYVPMVDGTVTTIEIHGTTILLTHGDKTATKGRDPEKAFDKLLRIYPEMDYLLSGHIHETLIGARFARSGSLCGNNAYSQGLCLTAPASQSIHIVDTTGAVTSIAINLQDVSEVTKPYIVPEMSCMVGQQASKDKLTTTYKFN